MQVERYTITKGLELVLCFGDITRVEVDAIVNAANEHLLGGGGVDGAIHRAAGPELRVCCKALPELRPRVRCPVGEARITPGFGLPSPWVIHAVGPVYRSTAESAHLLASAYRSSLLLAQSHGLRSIAFPAISCGFFGYPVDEAAAVAFETSLAHAGALAEIRFVLFDDESLRVYRRVLESRFVCRPDS